jgi:hypothetical protein
MRCSGAAIFAPQRGTASERVAFQRQRMVNIGAEQCLNEQVANRFRIQITKNFFGRKRMLGAERNYYRVVCCRCLKLKIERAAKTFSQGKSPARLTDCRWR